MKTQKCLRDRLLERDKLHIKLEVPEGPKKTRCPKGRKAFVSDRPCRF